MTDDTQRVNPPPNPSAWPPPAGQWYIRYVPRCQDWELHGHGEVEVFTHLDYAYRWARTCPTCRGTGQVAFGLPANGPDMCPGCMVA